MNVKKLLLITIITISIKPLYSQTYSVESAKEAINAIWLVHYSAGYFSEPADYIYDTITNNVIGQNLLTYRYGEKKYETIKLLVSNNTIMSAQHEGSDVILKWANNRLSKVNIKGHENTNCTINYNQNNEVIGLTVNELNNKKQTSFTLEYINGKLSRIIKYYDIPGEKAPWIHIIRNYTYNQNKIEVNEIYYKFNKDNKPKNIKNNETYTYKKLNDSTVSITKQNSEYEMTYDKDNRLISMKVEGNDETIESYTYKYINGKLSRKDKTIIKAGIPVQKDVSIILVSDNLSESASDYEKTIGFYRFDANNELIYEKKGEKCREKINGIWSDWMYMRY